jgi:hypothetical protein
VTRRSATRGRERKLLKKGLGDVGVDIFCREAQAAWEEPVPFADRRGLDAARRREARGDPRALQWVADRSKDFFRLVAALLWTGLDDDYGALRRAARERGA